MAARSRILVVEDDASLRRAIARFLDAAGYDQTGFASAEDLIASNAASTASCLVTDIHLPGMSGFNLVDLLRQRHRRMPAVFITALDSKTQRDRVACLDAAAYLAKPFEAEAIVKAIRSVSTIGLG